MDFKYLFLNCLDGIFIYSDSVGYKGKNHDKYPNSDFDKDAKLTSHSKVINLASPLQPFWFFFLFLTMDGFSFIRIIQQNKWTIKLKKVSKKVIKIFLREFFMLAQKEKES